MRPLKTEHARAREVVDVVPRSSFEGPILAVSRECAEDQARVLLEQRRVRQPEPIEHARAELLEQHVVSTHEVQQRSASLGLLEVDADRALVAVEREEHRARRHGAGLLHRRHVTQIVAAFEVLHLVHACAQIGKNEGREGSWKQSTQIENADFVKCAHSLAIARA